MSARGCLLSLPMLALYALAVVFRWMLLPKWRSKRLAEGPRTLTYKVDLRTGEYRWTGR